ncbi:acyl carrier protein [uncultured Gimesia sp.]|uniref:acyl carrier protein n=1 Tax=uncultured Gimesia sp. TaxID=1678688 RepID=UPI003455FE45
MESLTKRALDLFGSAPDKITGETSFKDFNVDSLEFVELVMAMEDEFDITIPDDAFHQIQTLGDFLCFAKFK